MESMTLVNECPALNKFCHDLARFYSLFMFTTKPYMRAFLHKSAVELQKWDIYFNSCNDNFSFLLVFRNGVKQVEEKQYVVFKHFL